MTCERATLLLGPYHDGELTDIVHVLELESHLEECAGCTERLEALRNLRRNVREKAAYYQAPDELRRNVAQAMRTQSGTSSKRAWSLPSFAFGTGFALAAVAAFVLLFPRPDGRLGDALFENHVRSLQADHLFDVASSSRHTVKPWFQGKVDFSPAVPDLAAQGFPLVGGRLDDLGGKPCVALVYKRFKHVINVFVARAPVSGSVHDADGFHVVSWKIHELDYWAVSDLNPAELREFGDKFVAEARE